MDTQKKTYLLNRIANEIYALERNLPHMLSAVKFGLHKGKAHVLISEYNRESLQSLLDALDTYSEPEFTLDDMTDYGKL